MAVGGGATRTATASACSWEVDLTSLDDAEKVVVEALHGLMKDPATAPPPKVEDLERLPPARWKPYPCSLKEMREARVRPGALVLQVPAGASVVGELDKLWHWVTGPQPSDTAREVNRSSVITYGTGKVLDAASDLLGVPGGREGEGSGGSGGNSSSSSSSSGGGSSSSGGSSSWFGA